MYPRFESWEVHTKSGNKVILGLLITEEQVPVSLFGPVMQLSGTILAHYRGTNSRLDLALQAAYTHICAYMYAQSSHIKIFGHLLLNQLPIFHICHGLHILPLLSIFFFFHQTIFSPHIWSLCWILHSFAFSLDTVFSSVAGFLFELNQISLRPVKDSVSVYVREARERSKDVCALWWPSLAHTSCFQLFFFFCYYSHNHDSTVQLTV